MSEVTTEKWVNWLLRWALLAVGMFASAAGIACVAQAALGTTPISSVPFVLGAITGFTFGEMTFVLNCVFVVIEWLLLRKLFHLTMLFQIPSVFVFGLFIDCCMHIFEPAAGLAATGGWTFQMAMSLVGNVLLSLGIVMQVESKTLVQPGEGVVMAASVRFKKSFGNLKIVFDVFLVIIAVVLGLVFRHEAVGVREGTLVSAVMVGFCVKGWYKVLKAAKTVKLESSLKLMRRWMLLAAGMFITAVGIVCVAQAALGTTPVSSVPFVLSLATDVTFGRMTFFVNVLFVFLQWLILRRDFNIFNLLQIPGVWVLGCFIDLAMEGMRPVTALMVEMGWTGQMAMTLVGIVIVGLGIAMQVASDTLVQPGDGLALAISMRTGKAFGDVKIVNDVSMVLVAMALSYATMGELVGVREGTLVAAVLVGVFVKAWFKLFEKLRTEAT